MNISNKIYEQVAQNLNLDKDEVKFNVNAYYKEVRRMIKSIPIDYKTVDEEYLKANKTSFILPGIGKLMCNINHIKQYRKKMKYTIEHNLQNKKKQY